MADWKLIKKDMSFYVEGLAPQFASGPDYTDTLLIVFYGEDCDTISEPGEKMHSSLYDTYQRSGKIKDGDTFSLDGVVLYKAEGVHVIEANPKPKDASEVTRKATPPAP